MLLLDKLTLVSKKLNQLIIRTGAVFRWLFRNLNNV